MCKYNSTYLTFRVNGVKIKDMVDENSSKVLTLLKSMSRTEESKNGDKGHVIWSNEFYKLAQDLVKLFPKPDVNFYLKIPPPNLKQKNIKEKSIMAKKLRDNKYSIREIMNIMGYKSPSSIQLLLEK